MKIRKMYYSLFLDHIGDKTYFGRNIMFKGQGKIIIGNNSAINDEVSFLCDGLTIIGNNTHISPRAILITHTLDKQKTKHIKTSIIIGSNVWIGAGAIILGNCIIEDNAIVGAGSVVTNNINANTIVAAVPAKKIGVVK